MGYQYYASATFPVSARKIPEIAAMLDEGYFSGEFTEENGLICLSDTTASNGNLYITELLEEYSVPYDHYHRDDNACSVWTDRYRLNAEGKLVEVCSTSEDDEALSDFAKEVLENLENGNTEQVNALLNDAIGTEVESIEDIAAGMVQS